MKLTFSLKQKFILISILAIALASCTQSSDCSSPKVFCAGLVTDTGGLQDHGLTQSAWEGIQRALDDKTIQHAAFIESVDARDYGKNIETFAQAGYDVIVTSGIGLNKDTLLIANRYPAAVFIGLDQPPDSARRNFIAMSFPKDREGFLAGAAAALVTKTDVVGAVCETSSLDSIRFTCEGFQNGARYVDPKIFVLIKYRDDGNSETLFRDSSWGHDTALAEIQQGADVIFGVGGGTGQGALIAAAEQGVYAVGSEQDQFYVTREAGKALITSIYARADSGVYELIRSIRAGQWPVEYQSQMTLAPFHDLNARLPESVKQSLSDIFTGLERGAIETGVLQGSSK